MHESSGMQSYQVRKIDSENQIASTKPQWENKSMTPKEHLKLIKSRCTEEGSCWLWTGAQDGHGRPQMRYDGKVVYVRRMVRELADGKPIPPGLVAASHCGQKLCVSPLCSCVATDKKRAQMAAARGAFGGAARTRKMTAAKHAKSRITPDMVQAIRMAPPPCSRISAEVGVSLSHVKAIRRGTARRDLVNPFFGLLA